MWLLQNEEVRITSQIEYRKFFTDMGYFWSGKIASDTLRNFVCDNGNEDNCNQINTGFQIFVKQKLRKKNIIFGSNIFILKKKQ